MTLRLLSSVVVLLLSCITLEAQWPQRRDASTPRRPDGTVNLQAPPPRSADGRVDFSGIWSGVGFCPGDRFQHSDSSRTPADRERAMVTDRGEAVPLATCFDIGAHIPGGAPLQPSAAALRQQRMRDNLVDSPQSHCLPLAPTQLWMNGQPRQIVHTPREVLVLFEANSGVRHLYTDGRALPDADAVPWWYGYTVATWEGDTLVATTTKLREGTWLDVNGTPLTERARIVERIRRPVYGLLEIEMTIDDPGAFTRPFTVGVRQELLPDGELMEFICHENERSSRHFVRP